MYYDFIFELNMKKDESEFLFKMKKIFEKLLN